MQKEKILETWISYLKKELEYDAMVANKSYLIHRHECGTCAYWFFLDVDSFHHLAGNSSPEEYDRIIRHFEGKWHRTYEEHGEIVDVYSDYRFYGMCKRYPPVQRSGYSVISFRSLFTRWIRHVPKKIAEFDFPLMPNDSGCGEWKKGDWVDNFIKENTGKAQQSDSQ